MNCRCGMEIEKAVVVIGAEEFCSFECAGQLAPYSSKMEVERIDTTVAHLTEKYDKLQAAIVLPKRVISEPKASVGGLCEICEKEPAISMAVSTLGPVIYKYGRNCLEIGSEPYQALVLYLKKKGGRKNITEASIYAAIDATLLTANKSIEELDDDIARQ